MTDTTSSPLIVVDKLDKWFGDHHVLKDINLAVARGEGLQEVASELPDDLGP